MSISSQPLISLSLFPVCLDLLILEVFVNRIIQYLCFLCLARKGVCFPGGFEGGRLGGNMNLWRQEGRLCDSLRA